MTVAETDSRPESSLTRRGSPATVLQPHAHLSQEVVQGALLSTPVDEVVEGHQEVTLPPGDLHIVKDIPFLVQHRAAHERFADGHRAEAIAAHEALVEH